MSLRKVTYEAFIFLYFREIWKNEATDLAVSQLRRSTIAIISAHVACVRQHMPEFKFSKTVEVGWLF